MHALTTSRYSQVENSASPRNWPMRGHQFQKDLLRDIAGHGWIAMKKIERDRIHTVLIQVVEHTKGVPVARAASFDDLRADLAITQINHRRLRRNGVGFSSIFPAAPHLAKPENKSGHPVEGWPLYLITFGSMVRMRGLEPPRPCDH